MAIVFDLIILVVLAVTILLGYKNGLIRSLISLFGWIIAIVLAFSFSTTLGNFIGEKVINPPIQSFVSNSITQKIDKNLLQQADVAKNNVASFIEDAVNKIDIDIEGINEIKTIILNNLKKASSGETVEQTIEKSAGEISNPIANSIGKTIAFILIIIVVNLALMLIKFLFGFVDKLPIIKQFNKIGGLLIGILNGILVILIALAILKFAMPFIELSNTNAQGAIPEDKLSSKTIDDTYLTKIFYINNPIKF